MLLTIGIGCDFYECFFKICSVKYSILFFYFTCQVTSFAQVLNNSKGEAFGNKPFFNQSFIYNNKIQSIKGQFNYKNSGKAMYSTDYFYAYNFNKSGQLESTFETRKDDGSVDTTWNEYVYDQLGNLAEHKQGLRQEKYGIIYHYDNKNRVISEDNYTESIDSTGRKIMLLVNSETMTYIEYGQQLKKTLSNSYGLPYKTEMSYFDENGYLLETEERYITTSNFLKKLYSYNENGLLIKIETYQKGTEKPVEELHFSYDSFGNLLEKHLYQNGVFITDTQIVYNEKTKLMTAVIIREVKTDFIMVIRFSDYSYYEN